MRNDKYEEFLARKRIIDPMTGIKSPNEIPEFFFPHQRDICKWALRRGRAAIFAGTGLGKTLMELEWARQVIEHTGKSVIIFAPLAVSHQHLREAATFGFSATIVHDQSGVREKIIYITNYQKMDHFDLSAFGGVCLDESSILKSQNGHYRSKLIEECSRIPFRLAATATPAPNDFMELGNHAEFLGIMSYTDMLATFFTHDGGETQKWRLKGHAENEFWRWMASWAVMLRKPSDLGYDNAGYDLPPLNQIQHTCAVPYAPNIETGLLFPVEAHGLGERIAARRGSVSNRVAMVFSLVIGSFYVKLEECGNLNMPLAAEQNINPTLKNDRAERCKGERLRKTPNICVATTNHTEKNLSVQKNSKKQSISAAESDTRKTRSSENYANSRQISATKPRGALGVLDQNMGSEPQNTTNYLPNRMARVPYVVTGQNDIYSLIIAMTQAKSGGFFAAPAIPASAISKMTRDGLIEPWCIWCNLNSEQDALAAAFGPLAFSVSGSTPDEQKEKIITAWLDNERPIMISKPLIMGFGMNFQHCQNTVFVGLNDSFEQFYQAIRRFYRFGQTKPVNVHFIAAETEGAVVSNLRRKESDADRMADAMVTHMADLCAENVRGSHREISYYEPRQDIIIPSWMEDVA